MTETNKPIPQEDNIDLRRFLIKLVVNWPLFLVALSVAFAIAYLINRYTEPIYSVNASILINDERKSTSELLISALDRYGARKNVENEMAILRSYSLTRRALKELDFSITYYILGRVRESRMYNSNLFKVEIDTTKQTRYNYPIYFTIIDEERYLLEIDNNYKIKKILRFGESFNHPDFNFTITLDKNSYKSLRTDVKNKFYFVVNELNSLTNQYKGRLNVSTNEKKSTIINLSFSGPVPEQSADCLNKLCEVYLKTGQQ